MLFRSDAVTATELARVTGWHVRPEGLCRDDRCVPFAIRDTDAIALTDVSRALGMPLVHDERHGLWALGAETGGHAIATATAPDLTLPDVDGRVFRLSSLRGMKVLLVAWASW